MNFASAHQDEESPGEEFDTDSERSLCTDVLFSQKIVGRANENNKPREMTANAWGWEWVNERRLWTD